MSAVTYQMQVTSHEEVTKGVMEREMGCDAAAANAKMFSGYKDGTRVFA